ncbi:MAG: YbaB/EbfC family nucleoid-associated protein [Acidimicrobiales bacterium]|jgi:DNA-binding YbaB/EbfC family protein
MAGSSGEALSRQMDEVRRQLAEAERSVGANNVTGTAGDGAVRIGVGGEYSFTSVEIDPRVVDPAETELLEDLVLAALRDAATRLADQRRAARGAAMGGLIGQLFGPEDAISDNAGNAPATE